MTKKEIKETGIPVIPAVRPGRQWITIIKVGEFIQSDKGYRIEVEFECENGSKFRKMYFEKSIRDHTEYDINNMANQLGLDVIHENLDNVLVIDQKYWANVAIGVDKNGYTRTYPNIQGYTPYQENEEDEVEL